MESLVAESARFEIRAVDIPGPAVMIRKPIADARGFLERLYCDEELAPLLGDRRVVAINRTLTRKQGTIRGLHFQLPPHAEGKAITCLRGRVFDVAVDLRRGSPTFLRWTTQVLDAAETRTFWIPEGFAHGFQTLTEDCELLYLHTARYQRDAERGLDALDPRIGIAWPLAVSERSDRDSSHPTAVDFGGIES